MKRFLQTKLLSAVALFSMIAILCLLISSFLAFPLQSRIGPYKMAMIIGLVYVVLMALDLRWNGYSANFLRSWLLMILGGGYFVAMSVLSFRFPNRPLLNEVGLFSFLALMALGAGALLRLNMLTGERFMRPLDLSERAANILAVVYLTIGLIPILGSGYYWDDAFHSVIQPALRVDGGSIWQRTWDEILLYASRGRINPFATFQFIFFYVFADVRVYKVFLVLLTIAASVSFLILARKIFHGNRLTMLMALILPLTFQVRAYHDPLTGYYGLMQMLMLEITWSLFLFISYLREGKRRYLIGSFLLFIVGLLSYEMFYPLLALFPLVAWAERKSFKAAVRASLGHVAVAFALAGMTFALRLLSARSETAAYSGTVISPDLEKIFVTWLRQMIAAFPFSYRLLASEAKVMGRLVFTWEIFKTTFSDFMVRITWGDVVALLIVFILLLEARKWKIVNEIRPFHWLFGLGLLACSSIVIALSAKYQFDINDGVGYIPVFIGYFAATWLIFLCLMGFYPRLVSRLNANSVFLVGYAVFAVIYCMNQQTNREVIRVMNEEFLYSRETAEDALRAGILEPISGGDLLVSNQAYVLWENAWEHEIEPGDFYALNHGKKVNAVNAWTYLDSVMTQIEEQGEADKEPSIFPSEATFVIEYQGNDRAGLVKFAKLVSFSAQRGDRLVDPVVNSVYLFIRGFDRSADTISYTGWNGQGFNLPIEEAWLLKTTDRGRLYKIDDPRSIWFDSIGLTSFR